MNSRITSLTFIRMQTNPRWFDKEQKVAAWAAVFAKQKNLGTLWLKDCNIHPDHREMIKQACPSGCYFDF